MSEQKGYAIWELGKGVIVVSYPRFNQARIKCEEMNKAGVGALLHSRRLGRGSCLDNHKNKG